MREGLPDFAPLTISAVERDTGLSKDTLRVWERRYGFPTPERDAAGERIYSLDQLEKLRLIKRLIDQGFRPRKLVGAPTAELMTLIEQRRGSAASRVPSQTDFSAFMELLRAHRADELRASLGQLVMKHGLQRFVIDCVAPLNVEVGEAWMRGEIEVYEEHLYTEQMQNTLRSAIVGAQPAALQPPKVLLSTFPEEEHALGLLMVEATLLSEGTQCVSLGVQTPLTHIREAAIAGNFDVVALSFSAAYSSRQAVEGLLSLRGALPERIAMWAGGEGIRDKARQLPGIQTVGMLAETLDVLQRWRAEHCT
jgi:DNA-binding transcriptional MerR regulator/methylmalonyl-CoA mutase cobalamin-binding subunit